jgi:KipI family sensor histidine kinase inhibitor
MFALEPLGDRAALLTLGARVDTALNARALALAQALRAAALPGIEDIVPAYASVCVRYEPCAWVQSPERTPFDALADAVRATLAHVTADAPTDTLPPLDVPVCYGGEFGPDLIDVAAHVKLTPDEVVTRHLAGEYRVAMLGFAPGFPYLLGLDATLHVPRRANPRTRVPAGSVAIGGAQTGIYPRELPGGWQLIGRTPLALFDAARTPPALCEPGRRVRFRAIGSAAFAAWSA